MRCQVKDANLEAGGTFALTVNNNSANGHLPRDLDPGRGLRS